MGVEFARGICGVSVNRSGESMETALRECCQGIKLGKILVHRWVWGGRGVRGVEGGEGGRGIKLGKILVHRWGG